MPGGIGWTEWRDHDCDGKTEKYTCVLSSEYEELCAELSELRAMIEELCQATCGATEE